MCEVGKKPYIKEIPNKLEEMQKLIGGYIEVVSLINGLIVVCNEEGRLMNLPINNNLGLNILLLPIFIFLNTKIQLLNFVNKNVQSEFRLDILLTECIGCIRYKIHFVIR